MRRLFVALGLVVVTVLATGSLAGAVGEQATGDFIDAQGRTIGRAEVTQEANQVRVIVRLNDAVVSPGLHGLHFHAVGKCDPPDFMTAGGHFNPTGKKHGFKNPAGPHVGDLANLPIDGTTLNQSGKGYTFVTTSTMVTVTPGPNSLLDADGSALVIHAGPDDEVTDPAGNSGARVACAVLRMSAMPGLPNTGAGGLGATPPWLIVAGFVVLALTAVAGATARRRRA